MKILRRIVFWLHLATGVSAGAVVLIMSVTGVLLTYEKQMLRWADTRAYRQPPPDAGAQRAADRSRWSRPSADANGGAAATTVTLWADPVGAASRVAIGTRPVYVNPYTGVGPRRGFGEAACVFQARDRLASLARRGCRPGPRRRRARSRAPATWRFSSSS